MDSLRNFALWVIVVLMLLTLFTLFQNPSHRTTHLEISFSQFIKEVESGRVRDVFMEGPEVFGNFTDGRAFQTYAPNDPTLAQRLVDKGMSVVARPQRNEMPWFVSLIVSWLPFLALIGVWVYLARHMKQASGTANHSASEIAALKRQIDDLRREIAGLKGSQKTPG